LKSPKCIVWLPFFVCSDADDRLAAQDTRKARVVELRYFVGFGNDEAADVLGSLDAVVLESSGDGDSTRVSGFLRLND